MLRRWMLCGLVATTAMAEAKGRVKAPAPRASAVEAAIDQSDVPRALEGIEALPAQGRRHGRPAILDRLLVRAGSRGVECQEAIVNRLVERGAAARIDDVLSKLDATLGCAPLVRFLFRDASGLSKQRLAMAAVYLFPKHIERWRAQWASDEGRATAALDQLAESFRLVVGDLQMQSGDATAEAILEQYLAIKRDVDGAIARIGTTCTESDADCVASRERATVPLRKFL